MNKGLKSIFLVAFSLVLFGCGSGVKTSTEKIAVIKWDKAVSSHPEYPRLKQGEKIVENLVHRRDAQAKLGTSQMESVSHLRGLKQLSEKSYLEAELQTKLFEKQQVNNAKIFMQLKKVEAEVEKEFAPQRAALEEEYRLRIFNLRIERDRLRTDFRPREGKKIRASMQAADAEIQKLKNERELRVAELEQVKKAEVTARIEPFANKLSEEMQIFADETRIAHQKQMAAAEGKYDKMMSAAPEALANALTIMDKEIDKQQDKNKTLKKQINSDIENIAVKLAHQRGYSIVFNTFKVNVSADDITNDIISEFKNVKKK